MPLPGGSIWRATICFAVGLVSGVLLCEMRTRSACRMQDQAGLSLLPDDSPPAEGSQVESLQRALTRKDDALMRLERKNSDLADEYRRLQQKSERSGAQVRDSERVGLFRSLEPFLLQLPVVAADVQAGEALSAEDIVRLLGMIPHQLRAIGIMPIGVVGEVVPFDPAVHRPVASKSGTIATGEKARVVVPGYRYEDVVLVQAEVSAES